MIPVVSGVAVLVLLVFAAWLLSPASRAVRGPQSAAGTAPMDRTGGSRLPGAGDPLTAAERRRRTSRWRRPGARGRGRLGSSTEAPQFGRVLVEVAARLRGGATVEHAWQQALATEFTGRDSCAELSGRDPSAESTGRYTSVTLRPRRAEMDGRFSPDGVPSALAALHDQLTGVTRSKAWRMPERDRRVLAHQVAGAVVACRVAHRSGAPVADLLQRCAQGLVEAAEADAARRQALAGPRATAGLLGWLPVAGIGLGWAWGADPVGVLLGGGWGGLCLVAGVGLMVAGRVWVNRLVRTAQEAGQ